MNNNYYGYVYMILDQKHNKVYIGQKKGTIEGTRFYYGSGKIIKRIIKKRGKFFLKKIILGTCQTRKELRDCETECKYFYNSFDRKYGYNIYVQDGTSPMTGKHHTKETKEKMSKASIGKPKSEEHKENLRKANFGKKLSENAKEKMKKAFEERKEKGLYVNGMKGKIHTKEWKENMSKLNKGRKHSTETILKLKDKHKGKVITQEQRLKIKETLTGKIWNNEYIFLRQNFYSFIKDNKIFSKKTIINYFNISRFGVQVYIKELYKQGVIGVYFYGGYNNNELFYIVY